jgi:hypothetical protein
VLIEERGFEKTINVLIPISEQSEKTVGNSNDHEDASIGREKMKCIP